MTVQPTFRPELQKGTYSSYPEIRLIRLPVNNGKGAAVTAGVRASTGDTVVVQDADLELDPADIPALLEKLQREDLDIVSGTRFRSATRLSPLRPPCSNRQQVLLICCISNYREKNH